MKALTIVLMLNSLILNVISEQPQYLLNKISTQQKRRFKQTINGRTLRGQWGCVQQLFYESAQCKYFNVPIDPNKMIAQIDQYLQPMTFFKSKNQGHLEGFFYSSGQGNVGNKLYLLLFRQKYRTDQVIELDIDLSKADKFQLLPQKNHTKIVAFQQQNVITTANLYENEELFVKFDLSISIEIFVLQDGYRLMQGNNEEKDITVPVHVRVFSDSLSFSSELKSPQSSNTILILAGLALAQIVFIYLNPSTSQQNVSKTRSIMFRISQWFILQMYAFIIVFSKQYINLGLKYFDISQGYLIYLGLGNLGIGLLFLRKYEMVLQKFTNKKMLLLGVLFFCGYWYIASKYFYEPFFWIIQFTVVMQLQILHSMANGGKGGLPYDLMGFMILSRIPFIYMQVSQSNIWNRPPIDFQYIKLLIGVFILHCIIILIQSIKGGQFIVPNSIIPGYYNYYITRQQNHAQLKQQCPICTSLLSKAPDSIEMNENIQHSSLHSIESSTGKDIEIQTSISNITEMKSNTITTNKLNSKTVKVMKTPCNHIFHIDCLTKWMQNKLVCPYCRTTLPQLASLQKE